ncbi:PREDICTED: RNA-binding protein 28 [Thamnophis sirtalis]|uniref:RNA-binding protein 28 n=1 Tax=Thamnophis sirtalis TaxID=35019 RepID=A0A6I9Z5Q0_9SAUR|nr:PREDICTED: RNA-binding protein 28 [Thamnophis sirtalis]
MAAAVPRACLPDGGGGMGRTVLVRGLPPSARAADLEREFGQAGPVRRAVAVTAPGGETCTGLGFVSFSLPEDAQRALSEIRTFGGRRVSLALARPKKKRRAAGGGGGGGEEPPREAPEPPKARGPPKKARLIVRNLSFKCTEEELKSAFAAFGTVLEASLPRKPDGKLRGFAFVQFKNVLEAGKALKGMNMKEIKERPVAVDWAVAREKYQAARAEGVPAGKKAQPEGAGGSEEKPGRPEATGPGRPGRDPPSPPVESEDEEQEASSTEQEEELGEGKDPGPKQKPRCSDVAEGRTLFLRNLSFDTEEEELGELLEQFGDLKYVRIVLHPETEHSKGCAFAQFATQEAAQNCLQRAQEETEGRGLHLGGRRLRVDLAVSREEAQQLRSPKTPKPTGTRNLYLAREGLIRAGTKAAEGVSDADMAKRARFEELKRLKLKDQNIFVSQTRLCVHNLPKSVDGAALRKVMLQAAGGGSSGARIKECRVMRELKGRGQSLGYAFVEFQQPQHALLALRHVNNNPQLFGDQKRPIVEFSLEDGRKLRLKEQRAERSRQKLRQKEAAAGPAGQGPPPGTGQPGAPQKPPKGSKKAPGAKGKAGGPSGPQAPPRPSGQKRKRPGPSPNPQVPEGATSWSGFQTCQEQETVELPDGTKRRRVLALPSHRGPKIRNRDKGQAKRAPPKKKKAGPRERKPPRAAPRGPQKRRAGQGRAEVRFEQLVEGYKQRILGAGKAPLQLKKSKWFEN